MWLFLTSEKCRQKKKKAACFIFLKKLIKDGLSSTENSVDLSTL